MRIYRHKSYDNLLIGYQDDRCVYYQGFNGRVDTGRTERSRLCLAARISEGKVRDYVNWERME